MLDGHPQRRNAKVGQDTPSIGEEENRPSVDGCSKNALPLRRIAAILGLGLGLEQGGPCGLRVA